MSMHRTESWVVYRFTLRGKTGEMRAVCEQSEWAAKQADRFVFCTLVRAGIASEGEAERLARGTSGDPVRRVNTRELPDRLPRIVPAA